MCGDDDLNPYFKGSVAIGLGATEILIGVFSIGFGIWGLLVQASYFYIFYPVWCGLLGVVAGSVAAATSSRPDKTMINATMGLSIVAVLAGACQAVFSTFTFLDHRDVQTDYFCFNQTVDTTLCDVNSTTNTVYMCTRWLDGYTCTPEADVLTGYSIGLACLVAAGIQFGIALAAAIICCSCCMKTDTANKVFPLSTNSTGTGTGGAPARMVSKTIQADIRPQTIRAKSMSMQTDSSFLSEVNPRQVEPTIAPTYQPQTQAQPQANQPQMPQIYILPMGGQGYQPQNNPPVPYYMPDSYQQHGRPPPNRDWVRDVSPVRPAYTQETPAKKHIDPPKLAEDNKPNPSYKPPTSGNQNSIARNLGGDEVVRVGDKLIHIRPS